MTSRLADLSRPVAFVLLVSAGLAAVVRLVAVLPGPLTPGDGGLIVVFVDDLRRAGFVMPEVTTYNDFGIPFVYPPLGLYVAAFLAEILGLSSLDGVRLVAGLLSLATVGTFAAAWAWTGVYFLSLVKTFPDRPGAVAGVGTAGLGTGNALGPVLFGLAADSLGYGWAWFAAALVAGLAAVVMFVAGRRF